MNQRGVEYHHHTILFPRYGECAIMQSPQPDPHPQLHEHNDHQQEKTPVSLSVIIGAVLVGVLALVCGVGALGTIPTLITHTHTPPPILAPTHTSVVATHTQA